MDDFRGVLTEGVRVTISPDHHWARGAKGTITKPPDAVRLIAGDWQNLSRSVRAVSGPITSYWVYFDAPQIDFEGDGPFVGAEIEGTYLTIDPTSTCPVVNVAYDNLRAMWYENVRLGLKVEFKAFLEDDSILP
jgi:hypothetical protein